MDPIKEAPTTQELSEGEKEFLEISFKNEPKEKPRKIPENVFQETAKPGEKKEEPPKKEETPVEPKKEETPKAEDPKPEPKKEEKPEPFEPIDTDDLAEKIADRIKPTPVKQEASDDDVEIDTSLDEDAQETLRAAALLNKDPRFQGKDLVKETKRLWKKEEGYIADWERANKDRKYDPDDEEHAEFYEKYSPSYTVRQLDKAKRDVELEEVKKSVRTEIEGKYEGEFKSLKAKELIREVEPLAIQASNQAVLRVVSEALPEFKAILEKDGLRLTEGKLEEMNKVHPEAFEFVSSKSEALKLQIAELEKLTQLGEFYELDTNKRVKLKNGESIRPHADIENARRDLEDQIAAMPQSERRYNGKDWVPTEALKDAVSEIRRSKLPKEVQNAKLNQLARKYWVVGNADVGELLVKKTSSQVKELLSLSDKIVTRRTKSVQNNGTEASSDNTDKKPDSIRKVDSPAITSSADTVATRITPANEDGDQMKEILAKYG